MASKIIFLLLFFIGFSFILFSQTNNKCNYRFVIYSCEADNRDTLSYWNLSTDFLNISKDTIYLVYKECSFRRQFISDNPEVSIEYSDCEDEEDRTLIITIPPKKSKSSVIRVYKPNHQEKQPAEFRLGYYIIHRKDFLADRSIINAVKDSEVVWSEKILIN